MTHKQPFAGILSEESVASAQAELDRENEITPSEHREALSMLVYYIDRCGDLEQLRDFSMQCSLDIVEAFITTRNARR